MKTKIFLSASLVIALFSCKKDKVEVYSEISQAQFVIPQTVGSYWLYQWYSIDTNGVETPLGDIDSVYISGDTTINGKEYIVRKGTWFGNQNFMSIQRDSSGYIVNYNGTISYSYNNFTDTLRTGSFGAPYYWDWHLKMYNNIPINIPLGSFSTIEARRYHYNASGGVANNCGDDYFTLGTWYANGVGKVIETMGYMELLQNCGPYLEARLIDYHIE